MNKKHCALSMRNTLMLAFWSLIISIGYSQPNTLITGKLSNAGLVTIIDLKVNQKYLTNNVDEYDSNVLEDGRFAFAVEINEPQFATLIYSRNKAIIYLEPGDTLNIEADANSFQYSLRFSGRSGHNNTCLSRYLKNNPQELDQFKMLQYQMGTYWFVNSPKMEELMMGNSREHFTRKMLMRKETAFQNMDFYDQNNARKLSADFKEFLSAEILYDWAYHMLLYGKIFKNKHDIEDDFFDFLDEAPKQHDKIGNYRYRDFIMAYLAYEDLKEEQEGNAFVRQHGMASTIFTGKPLAFLQSELITRALNANYYEEITPYYNEYFKKSPYVNFDNKLIAAFERAVKYAAGTPAPDFTLNNINGEKISLNSYKGQVVYLNFWASWCRPCMKKMNEMKTAQSDLEKKGVAFLHISLDRNEDKWKSAIEKNQFTGVHLFATGDIDSNVALDYEVRGLPQYFIINKSGRFAEKPRKYDLDEVTQIIDNLVSQ